MNKKRNDCIDSAKGVLILLVMLYHIIPGKMEETPIRYVIYSFTMSGYFFLSGYLFNVKRIVEKPVGQTAKQYAVRILIPWLVAFQVYYVIRHVHEPFSWYTYLSEYLRPYYHLWFCPCFLFCVAAACAAMKLFPKRGIQILLVLGGVFALQYMYYTSFEPSNKLILAIKYTVRPYFLLFFALGMYSRSAPMSQAGRVRLWIQKGWRLYILLFVAFLFVGYHYQSYGNEILVRYILLVLLYLSVDLEKHTKGIPVLMAIGKETYPLYLWHIIGKEIGTACGHVYLCYLLWLAFLGLVLHVVKKDNKLRFVIGR